ncbi:Mechanosensitive ion channel [Chitinophaga sp. YR627]|nr:Mechanosensitive ion channel [Chitinophaga sp. YR627]
MSVLRPLLLLLLFIYSSSILYAQHTDSIKNEPVADTNPQNFVERMKKFAEETKKKSIAERESDKAAILQDQILETVKRTMQRAKTYLKNGLDTTGINEDLLNIQYWHEVASDGILTHRQSLITYRDLTTTYNLLKVLESRALKNKLTLDNFQHRLSSFRFQLDSLTSDSAMFAFPDDSATLMKYLQKLIVVAREISPIDSTLKKAMSDVQTLQTQVNLQVYKIAGTQEEIESNQHTIYRSTFSRELSMSDDTVYQPFRETLRYSKAKSSLTLLFYTENTIGNICLLFVLMVLSAIYLVSLKRIYRQKNLLNKDFNGQLVLRYPVLSAIFIVLNVFQFILPAPPFLFSAIIWIIPALTLTVMFKGFIKGFWMQIWMALILLFLLACADNVLLQASRIERWGMLLLAAAGIVVGLRAIMKGRKEDLREQWIVYFIGLLAILELASVIANLCGRYNFAKTLLTSGYFNVIIAIMFLWTVRIINEGISLAAHVYTRQDKKLFFINFSRVGDRAPILFYCFMIAGWFILFGRNFYAFRLISGPVKDFLSQDRNVGDYTFSINTLLLFILIMGLSVMISKIVSYFASDRHLPASGQQAQKPKIGSWLLLIRISIISLGLFFAFAAAGIPMDKLAIVIGALSVGIGFGLQTVVNNLVSGLIIAFEKPVNVGDVVEIDNQSGTMKSIGFRSSVISTGDGADMVMPNGDLLNSHLINWTLGGSKRKMNLMLGIAYGTDLKKVQELLITIMQADERIVKYPAPAVIFQEFGDSAIDVKLFFWVRDMNDGFPVRSDLIVNIDQVFKASNISIPFPQQDIHIIREDTAEKKDNDKEQLP